MAVTQGHGNPNWSRDETILALDLYFQCKGVVPSSADQRVKDLSALLRSLPYHEAAARQPSFRNSDGVSFKLQNLRQVATGKGLGNVSANDRLVWKELGATPQKVRELADLIRAGIVLSKTDEQESSSDDSEEFFEGRLLTQLHKRRERHKGIRKKLIAQRRKAGPLSCDMCSSASPTSKHELEDSVFEAHHLVPIASAGESKTRLADMALLCANCHRLLHRAIANEKKWLDIETARKAIG